MARESRNSKRNRKGDTGGNGGRDRGRDGWVQDRLWGQQRWYDGDHPEEAVEPLGDLIVEACTEFAPDSRTVIEVRMCLGRALWRCGCADEAVEILRAALADSERTCGACDRLTFSCAGNLVAALSALRRFDEALELANANWRAREEAFGRLDNGTLYSLAALGQIANAAGRLDEAARYYGQLEMLRTEAFGKDDGRTKLASFRLGLVTSRIARDSDGIRELLTGWIALQGPADSYTQEIRQALAATLEDEGRFDEAADQWADQERACFDAYGEVAVPTLVAGANRLRMLVKSGRDGERRLLAAVCRAIGRIAGPGHPAARFSDEPNCA
jgi:tetratricopeptide (TPR) repeat protein